MIIDFHAHIFPPEIRKNRSLYLARDPTFAALYSNPKAKIATIEELIHSMDETGVDISVALNLGWADHQICVETNDYIIEAIARYPHRLVGFCTLQPRAGEKALVEMERCAKKGVKGIGELRPDEQGFDLGDETTMKPFMEEAGRHGLAVLTHASEPVGHSYPGKGSITPQVLFKFIAHFPNTSIVCSHWGGGLPFYALMPEVAQALQKVFFDTAASPFLYRREIYESVTRTLGPERILFGTDYPLMSQKRAMEELRQTPLPQRVKGMILGQNAQRLLNLGER